MHSSFLNKWDEPSMLHELLAKHPLINIKITCTTEQTEIDVGACELFGL